MSYIIPLILSTVFLVILAIAVRMFLLIKKYESYKFQKDDNEKQEILEKENLKETTFRPEAKNRELSEKEKAEYSEEDKRNQDEINSYSDDLRQIKNKKEYGDKNKEDEIEPSDYGFEEEKKEEDVEMREEIFLSEISRNFKKKLEEVLKEETKKVIFDFREEDHRTSYEILDDYKDRAKNINQDLKATYLDLFKEMSYENEKIREQLNQTIEEELIKYREENSKVSNFLMEEVQNKSEILLTEMNQKFNEIYKPLENTIKIKIDRTEREIEDYKKERLTEADQKIYEIIKDVTQQVIGRIIDPCTHEKLVMDSLERAKKEKFFSKDN